MGNTDPPKFEHKGNVVPKLSQNGISSFIRIWNEYILVCLDLLDWVRQMNPFNSARTLGATGFFLVTLGLLEAKASEDPGIELFEKQIRPLLIKHCYECHSTREPNGGLILDTREGLSKGGDSGPTLVAGDPDKSRLIEAVRYQNRDLQMPPKNKLSQSEIDSLVKWVKLGAPDPRKPVSPGAAPAPLGMSIKDGKNFWSFKPLMNAPVPKPKNSQWIKNPIDAFVLEKLDSKGLQPAQPADKRTLIRRMTYDLTGLPPKPEEIEAYLSDKSPDATNQLIERLLKSPSYGIRWGRHWLDVARYADSNGLDENLALGNAWRYRDYVVDSFNKDKPFDQFVMEQIAGDILPGANQETRTATGFLVLGAKVLAEPDREKLDMDTIDEQIDTMGKAFLGMTLGCVRCHDHKFDPVKLSDYYGMAAILKGTKTFGDTNYGAIKHWNEYTFADAAELEKLKSVEKAIADKKAAASTFRSNLTSKLRAEAKSKAAEYLKAAAQFDSNSSLGQIEEIAKAQSLHPRVLHHCRKYLDHHPDDTFFAPWHKMAAVGDFAGIETFYKDLFRDTEAAIVQAKNAKAKTEILSDAKLELARNKLNDTSGFLTIPPKPEFAFDDKSLAEYYRLSEEARVLESNAPDAAGAMGVAEGKVQKEIPIPIRGNHRNPGKPVPRNIPEVMWTSTASPVFRNNQSGRWELAQWLASTQNPLTARVFVNRVWRWHFGSGIVKSTENFGRLGDQPTHPELLDWLAKTFMESGWSIKDLHRLIMTSNTYQMASNSPFDGKAKLVDPENSLLWRFNLQRLEAEEVRDAILAVSGRLDNSLGGKSIPLRNRQFVFDHTSIDHTKYDSLRRAIYLPVVRNNLYTFFEQFDFPDPTMPTGSRNSTVVAPQALLMMNSELIMDSANIWAASLLSQPGDDPTRLAKAYNQAFGRPPTKSETDRILAYIAEQQASASVASNPKTLPEDAKRTWALVCQSILASNEFLYLR